LTVATDVIADSSGEPANGHGHAPGHPQSAIRNPQSAIPPGWVRLSVRDDGEGMSEQVLARIFEPFFSTKERGPGLGLAVVRPIVASHGGRVEVESRPGQGARFDVWLPRCR